MQLQHCFDPIVNRVIGHNSRATNAHFSFYIKTSVKSVQVGAKILYEIALLQFFQIGVNCIK